MEELDMGLMTTKIIIGFAALFMIVIWTGRTSIYQLTLFHLVFVLVLGEFLGNALYENDVHTLQFLYGTGLWLLLMLAMEYITQKWNFTRSFLIGDPAIIIRNGSFDRQMMKKNKVDINQVQSLLRQNSVFSVREVKYGILEANGQISLLLKSQFQNPIKEDLNLPAKEETLPIALIIDGDILEDNLKQIGCTDAWLRTQLNIKGYTSEKDIFFADWEPTNGIHICPK
ncbi:YetF domain-containing protein [Falsibacillus pallidus]|uniref:Uncharacterized membrane protein YcaP (DUF421 family) n=1 Tax=Falsibacillus pallidus TaxID=493781 RepID=A0A370GQ56_9BACI|nr:DUF421 domain-containing protein [Falsibacillus pallidus]RDI45858.1 uncharacterized membrane protein YcaP (DUF421 family) [Falsibacillus pallidus]